MERVNSQRFFYILNVSRIAIWPVAVHEKKNEVLFHAYTKYDIAWDQL